MQDLPKLIDAICDNYSNALPGRPWAPQTSSFGLTTFCNFFVNQVACSMGYNGFLGGNSAPTTANGMIDIMDKDKSSWLTVDGEAAQEKANMGCLVIAGQKAAEHGHVCVVRPGEMMYSGNWAKKVPRCCSVGKDVFINKFISFAFASEPTYYVFIG